MNNQWKKLFAFDIVAELSKVGLILEKLGIGIPSSTKYKTESYDK